MNSPALQAHLDPAGKVLDDPPAFLPWDRSYCCCDSCLQVRDSLGVVAIHPVLKISPQIKIWWVKSGECGDHCRSHLQLIRQSGKHCCSHANDSFEVWAWHHPAGTTGGPWRPLSVDQVLSRICQAPGHGVIHKWRHTLTGGRSPDLWQGGGRESVVLWCHTSRFDMHATRSQTRKERCGGRYVSIPFAIVFCYNQWIHFYRYC